MDKIKELVAICNSAEGYRIARMLNNASDYVRAVVIMDSLNANVYSYSKGIIELAY